MKAIIVCGSRHWTDGAMIRGTLAAIYAETPELMVIEGQACGVDRIAGQWADEMEGGGVGHETFPANWRKYGRAAGPLRNTVMLNTLLSYKRGNGYEIEVLAFHDDLEGSGTANMIDQATKAGVAVRVLSHEKEPADG